MFNKKKKKKIDDVKKVTFDEEQEDFEVGEEEIEEDVIEPVAPAKKTRPKAVPSNIKKTEEEIWVVKEVPVQTERVLYNQQTKKALDLYSAMAEILNRTEEEE